ncbi:hypothetical protein HXX76_012036 [Chlamydomonas incerta]|uniref:Uncharacterized protein n=1 Tax=Chlamydomonas incerta TaxID=51695 RepID=A0A835VW53_CHLIN|nr:hypothetical protein HXX76_012036 [Chlamydomonas incerta]|eukprot:KAG2428053.1 hypothetical protein HXX76_012036 [Chlamydomonas incerta]
MAGKPPSSSILIVPATSYEVPSGGGRKPRTPKKSTIVCSTATDDVGAAYYDPRNFLVRGGHRAFEQKVINMNKCAIQELRTANSVLADELMKARSGTDEVRDQLRFKENSVDALQGTLERAEKERRLLEKKHLMQLKEMNKRYKEEQAQRLLLESECGQLRAGKEALEGQLEALQEEKAQLLDLVNSQRNNSSRLEATVAGDAATIAELRSRVQAAESRLADEASGRQELFGRHKALEADFTLLSERHSALTTSNNEAEAKLRAATSRAQLLEDELAAIKPALQAEKAALAEEKKRSASLQSDLTQLQSTSTLAAAAAASDQAELQRLRNQTEQLLTVADGLRAEVAKLREDNLHLAATGVASQASAQQLQQQRDELQMQLSSTRDSLERRIQQLETGWRDDSAAKARAAQEDAAARQRAHAEEVATKQRAASEELAAKQRAWDTELRAREKTWEEEWNTRIRAHEEELARKDLELLEVRERMREAQTAVAELATEVATFKFQSEHFEAVFREAEEGKKHVAELQDTLRARDAALAEAASQHGSQLELWKAEANDVAQAAAKWKQRCTQLQAQLDARDAESDASGQELRSLASRLSASETERMQLQEAMAGADSKLALSMQEAASYKAQLADVLTSHESASRHLETAKQDLHARDMQLSKLNVYLSEEAARAAELREQLATATAHHSLELDAKSRALADVTEQLRDSERARVEALGEVVTLRDRVSLLTRELARARSVAEAVGAAARPPAAGGREELRRSVEPEHPQSWAYGGGSGGAAGAGMMGRHRSHEDEPITALEEEAESWFGALNTAPARPAAQVAPGTDPYGRSYAAHAGHSAAAHPSVGPVRSFDVIVSPTHSPAPKAAVPPAAPAPAPTSFRPPPAAAATPAHAGNGAGAAAAAAAAAASAYTALVTPLPHQRPSLASAAPASAMGAAANYPTHQTYRAYGGGGTAATALPVQPVYSSAAAGGARPYGAAAPMAAVVGLSPAMSDSTSTSSNLQERLQRLLGTGTLL